MSCFCFSVLKSSQDEDTETFKFILNAIWYLRKFLKMQVYLTFSGCMLSGKWQQVCKTFFWWQSKQNNSQTFQKTCRFSFATHAPLHHIPSKGARLSDSRLVIAVYSSAVPGQSPSSQGRVAVDRAPAAARALGTSSSCRAVLSSCRAVHAQPAAVICLWRGACATPIVCVLTSWAELVSQLPFTKQKRGPDTRHQTLDTRH